MTFIFLDSSVLFSWDLTDSQEHNVNYINELVLNPASSPSATDMYLNCDFNNSNIHLVTNCDENSPEGFKTCPENPNRIFDVGTKLQNQDIRYFACGIFKEEQFLHCNNGVKARVHVVEDKADCPFRTY